MEHIYEFLNFMIVAIPLWLIAGELKDINDKNK